MNVLIVGDDPRAAEWLALIVRQENWIPLLTPGVAEAATLHEKSAAQLAIVHWAGAMNDAAALCRALRQRLVIPIIAIVPATDASNQLRLYEAGVVDCISGPYDPRILQAKIRALLWLSGAVPQAALSVLSSGVVRLDAEQHTVSIRGGPAIHLTPLEFRLLYALVANAGRVLPADVLIYKIWGYTGEGSRDLLKGLVRRLRAKLEPDARIPGLVRTIPGVGYSFAPAEEAID